jgi:hypothetical protein
VLVLELGARTDARREMVWATTSTEGARHRGRGTPRTRRAGPRDPAGRLSPLALAVTFTFALALPLVGCAAAPAPAPLAERPAPPNPEHLLRDVHAQLQAARGAEVAFLLRYPLEGLADAQRFVDSAHAAVGRARGAVARLATLAPADGRPHGCCRELDAALARYDIAVGNLAVLAGRKGSPDSGLRHEAHRTLDTLDRYLVRLERAEDDDSPPTARAAAIHSLRADVAAIQGYEASYHRLDDIHQIASIGDRIVSQRAFLETSPLDARERARVDVHVQIYLIYLERVAVTDVEIYRVRRDLFHTAGRIQALVSRYLAGGDTPPLPAGRII